MKLKARYLEAVQNGIDYIEENLETDLNFHDISEKAHLSSWHFQRVFKAVTKETLKTYIRSRRLARAQKKLLAGNCRLIDVALDSGFSSPEAFSRAFKRLFGVSPTRFREQPELALFLNKVRLDADYCGISMDSRNESPRSGSDRQCK